MDNHTVRHYTTGVSTCPTLRGAKHFPSSSYFFIPGVYTVYTYFYYTKAILMSIGVREGILLGGRKKFALKVTFLV